MPESFFNKFVGLMPANFIKKETLRRCFPVNLAKSLKTNHHIFNDMNVDELLSLKSEKRMYKGLAWTIHSVSKTCCFASACDITITRVT